jgi:hypothetical protein
MFFVGKNFILHGQVHACAVYEVNNRQPVFHRYFLQAEILFACYWKPCAGFYGLIIGKDHGLASPDIANACNRTTRWASTLGCIHVVTCKCSDLYEWFVCITEITDTFVWCKFIFLVLFFDRFFPTSHTYLVQTLPQFTQGRFHHIFVLIKFEILFHTGGLSFE